MTLGPSSVSVYRLFKSDMLFGMAMRTSNGINDQRRREGRWVLIAVLRSYLHVSFGDRRQASPLLQRPGSGSPGSASGRKHLTLPCPALPCTFCQWGGRQSLLACLFFCFFVFLLGAANTVMCRRQRRSAQLQTGFSTISSITSIDRYLPPCRRRQRVLPGAQQHGQRPTIVRNVETCRKWRKSMFSALSSSQRSACHESDVC